MNHHRRDTGRFGEDLAIEFVQNLGWRVLRRNAHFRFGEVDILAQADTGLVIVEVKAKRTSRLGVAVEMITPAKRRTLIRLAKWLEGEYNKPVRVDVITIDRLADSQPVVRHYPFAIEEF